MIAQWSFDEGKGAFARDLVTGSFDKIEFALSKGRFQPHKEPEWRRGISGNALLFDGYSTYIRRSASEVKQPSTGLTITAWVVPRLYEYGAEGRLAAIINQHNREQGGGYAFGVTRHGAWSLQLGLDGEWKEVWAREHRLPLHEWSFVAATYSSATGLMRLYLNGEEVVSKQAAPPGTVITPCSGADLLVGRNNDGVILAEAFTMNNFCGLVDELTVMNRSLKQEEISGLFAAYLEAHSGRIPALNYEEIALNRGLFADDRHRPQFHASPPGHWMNEPHAPIYFNGQYHLFYQANPNGPFWHYIHWGHWVSEDLVHWRDLPPALLPEPGIDPDGVWSGSAAYDAQGLPALFFTAGNDERSPNQGIGLARSTYAEDKDNDLTRWRKEPQLIVEQKPGIGLFGQFRDPFVWQAEGRWYMLIGTGTEGCGGTAVVYTSEDMRAWSYRGPLFVSDYGKYPYLGTVWELPVLLPLPLARTGAPSGKHIFLISPWGDGADVEVFYWIGTFDAEAYRFMPDQEEPQLIDVGDFHFTGPSGMVDPKTGRSLLFTITQGERTPEIDYDCGWSHSAGLPVSLYLRDDGLLGVEPIEELRLLRGRELLHMEHSFLGAVNEQLASIHGDMLEIDLVLEGRKSTVDDAAASEDCGISLRRSPGGEEETVIGYDAGKQQLFCDRTRSTLDVRERSNGIQGGELKLGGEPLKLHICVDRSLIEAYANGVKSLTTRAYPSRKDADGLRLLGDEGLQIRLIRIWEMGRAFSLPVIHTQP
ncbi:GH32 C-terminal domain-containing protein [Paenibacillus sp. SM 69]|nr:GH32 C-terminal domain-containing protein [Paenibacillus oleatilyticus]